MKKPILIDVSLTGGRGPAKKAYELITDLVESNIPFVVLTDKGFSHKLSDLGINPDYIVNTNLNDTPKKIISEFQKKIEKIDYLFMVRLGARVAGPIASRKLGKPYIIVDGGLPDYLSDKEDLYEAKTFKEASMYLLTTQFGWKFPKRIGLQNVQICNYPISKRSLKLIDQLKGKNKLEIINSVKDQLVGKLPSKENELLINLVMTGDYLNVNNRVTYGAWLTSKQYDQSIGFIRRLVTDLGEYCQTKIFLFMDIELKQVIKDLEEKYSNVKILTFKKWDFKAELLMKAAADVTISRATNYQPYIAALEKGCNVTTPVPADGYMDEDTAAIQYQKQGLTYLIPYDDEKYVSKLFAFIADKQKQKRIKQSQIDNNKIMEEKNLIRLIVSFYKDFAKERR